MCEPLRVEPALFLIPPEEVMWAVMRPYDTAEVAQQVLADLGRENAVLEEIAPGDRDEYDYDGRETEIEL